MKKAVLIIGILVAAYELMAQEKIVIAPLKSVDLTYTEFAAKDVKLNSKSNKQIDVSVIDPTTKKQVSGFGLAPLGKAKMTVDEGNILRLKNTSAKEVNVVVSFVKREARKEVSQSVARIEFTLHNSSLKSIPLVIPDVMNPNLSPMSNSGVSLKVGQKIYYKKGLSKVLILTVDESIKQGDKIDVAKLVKNLDD
ncbi:MAG: hypothetical protein AAF616_08550 [Bacteroidota bacterium]